MPRKSVSNVEVVVTVAEGYRSKIAEVADRLKAAGLTSPQALESIGIVTGSVAPAALDHLGKVAGVVAVEEAGGVQIAPPDAEIQ